MATTTTTADGVTTARPKARKKQKVTTPKPPWWLWVCVFAILDFCLTPFYWLINISLKTGPDLSGAALFPPNPTLDNYSSVLKDDDFIHALRNSAIVSLITTAPALFGGSFCADALARLKFPLKSALLALVLSTTPSPPIAIATPV